MQCGQGLRARQPMAASGPLHGKGLVVAEEHSGLPALSRQGQGELIDHCKALQTTMLALYVLRDGWGRT